MLCYYRDNMEECRRWEGNIKMDLKEMSIDVYKLAQDRYHWRALVNIQFIFIC